MEFQHDDDDDEENMNNDNNSISYNENIINNENKKSDNEDENADIPNLEYVVDNDRGTSKGCDSGYEATSISQYYNTYSISYKTDDQNESQPPLGRPFRPPLRRQPHIQSIDPQDLNETGLCSRNAKCCIVQ